MSPYAGQSFELKQIGNLKITLQIAPSCLQVFWHWSHLFVINLELDEWWKVGLFQWAGRGQRSRRQVGTFKLCSAEAQQVPSQRRRRVRGDFGCLPLTSYILHTWVGGSTLILTLHKSLVNLKQNASHDRMSTSRWMKTAVNILLMFCALGQDGLVSNYKKKYRRSWNDGWNDAQVWIARAKQNQNGWKDRRGRRQEWKWTLTAENLKFKSQVKLINMH